VPDLSLGLSLAGGKSPRTMVETAVRAEELGFDSVWTFEAWGSDAFTPLGAIATRTSRIKLGTAIAGIWGRTPGATTMTALTLQELSGGRLLLGLGVSGPQVVEGWHGVPFVHPLRAMRDYIAVLRAGLASDARVEVHGQAYSVPYTGPGATGLGKPLRSTLPGHPETPIYIAAIGPQNVAMAVDVADGLLPYLWSPERWSAAWGDSLAAARPGYQIAPTVFVAVGDDIQACRDAIKPRIAFHIGGMGSREKNYYKDLVVRYGYEEQAQRIQDLFLGGDRKAATAAVSDELLDELALVGPRNRIADRLAAWRDGPVTTVIAEPIDADSMAAVAEVWHR
jgi:F420-dependent oxidoreductase-like protein